MEESSSSMLGSAWSPGQPRLAQLMAMDLSVGLEGDPFTVPISKPKSRARGLSNMPACKTSQTAR